MARIFCILAPDTSDLLLFLILGAKIYLTEVKSNEDSNSDSKRLKNVIGVAGLGVGLSWTLSTCLVDLWTLKNTANGNYLFFQGVLMWISMMIGMIELFRAL